MLWRARSAAAGAASHRAAGIATVGLLQLAGNEGAPAYSETTVFADLAAAWLDLKVRMNNAHGASSLPLPPPRVAAASSSGQATTRTSCPWACLPCCRPSRQGSRCRSLWPSCAGKAGGGCGMGARARVPTYMAARCVLSSCTSDFPPASQLKAFFLSVAVGRWRKTPWCRQPWLR